VAWNEGGRVLHRLRIAHIVAFSSCLQSRVMRSVQHAVLHTCTLVLLPQSHSEATLGYVDQLQDQAFDTLKGVTQQQ
jgi:hypothetical protein